MLRFRIDCRVRGGNTPGLPFWGVGGSDEQIREWGGQQSDIDELALSQWGLWSDELEPILLSELVNSYLMRQNWLAQMQAASTVQALSQALNGRENGGGGVQERVNPREILDALGVEIDS